MLDGYALAGAIGVDALEPFLDAVEEADAAAAFLEGFAAHRHAGGPRLFQHHIHIHQDEVGLIVAGQVVDLIPEFGGRHPDIGDELAFLHIAGGQGSIEIVHQGHRNGGSKHRLS